MLKTSVEQLGSYSCKTKTGIHAITQHVTYFSTVPKVSLPGTHWKFHSRNKHRNIHKKSLDDPVLHELPAHTIE